VTPVVGSAGRPRGGGVLAAAYAEAELARHGYVGCEHLLLALLREPVGVAGEVLRAHGVELQPARLAVRQVVADGRGDGPRWNQADLLAMVGVDLSAVRRGVASGTLDRVQSGR
jgi:ATP-dependent Clp protease ATP-binding subunit ClpA